MDDDSQPLIEKPLLLWCTPKSELLDAWNLKRDFGEYIVVNERDCRKDWNGLVLPSLRKVFASLHWAGVAPKHIPNVVMRSLYDDPQDPRC